MDTERSLHVLLAGGGTGGHVYPALAVAEEVLDRGGTASFVGSREGVEARLVPERGISFHSLPSRPVVGRGPMAKVAALVVVGISALRARGLVRRLGAQVVLGTGGYVSASPVIGGRLAGRPVVLLEPNAVAGAANRVLSRLAVGACLAFERAGGSFRCPTWTTGVPVRRAFFSVPDDPPSAEETVVLVVGGSQGARQLNVSVPAAVERIAFSLSRPLRVLHQSGPGRVEEARRRWSGRSLPSTVSVEVVGYVDDMATAIGESHLVVGRSGAVTVAEICAGGRAAIYVPLLAAGAHQRSNAMAVAEAGGATVVEGDGVEEGLVEALARLLEDRDALRTMGRAARSLARPDAASEIVRHLREVAA